MAILCTLFRHAVKWSFLKEWLYYIFLPRGCQCKFRVFSKTNETQGGQLKFSTRQPRRPFMSFCEGVQDRVRVIHAQLNTKKWTVWANNETFRISFTPLLFTALCVCVLSLNFLQWYCGKPQERSREYLFIGHNSGILTAPQSIFTLRTIQSGADGQKP